MTKIVSSTERGKWGSNRKFRDRGGNPYNDSGEFKVLKGMLLNDERLISLCQSEIGEKIDPQTLHDSIEEKPFGDTDIDAGIQINGSYPVLFEYERNTGFKGSWPTYYKCFHFLERKKRLLDMHSKFLYCIFNLYRTKAVIAHSDTIRLVKPEWKVIKKNYKDQFRVLKESDCWIVGTNLTDFEKNTFK